MFRSSCDHNDHIIKKAPSKKAAFFIVEAYFIAIILARKDADLFLVIAPVTEGNNTISESKYRVITS